MGRRCRFCSEPDYRRLLRPLVPGAWKSCSFTPPGSTRKHDEAESSIRCSAATPGCRLLGRCHCHAGARDRRDDGGFQRHARGSCSHRCRLPQPGSTRAHLSRRVRHRLLSHAGDRSTFQGDSGSGDHRSKTSPRSRRQTAPTWSRIAGRSGSVVLQVTSGYFRTLRVNPQRGRGFERADETGAPLRDSE